MLSQAGWCTAGVLWQRDVLKFLRQPSRLIGSLGQPLLFWGVIGSGMESTFDLSKVGTTAVPIGFSHYFFPGVMTMIILFASIFASVSLFEDLAHGFLRCVLVGPGEKSAIVVGKCLGSSSVALLQVAVFLVLLPLAGFSLQQVAWGQLLLVLVLLAMALSNFGFMLALTLSNVQAYHAIQMLFLVPLWVVSGAMFPLAGTALQQIAMFNPLSYALSAIRAALYGQTAAPALILVPFSQLLAFAVLSIFAAMTFVAAIIACHRKIA